jgi:hypothetical protein
MTFGKAAFEAQLLAEGLLARVRGVFRRISAAAA